jgi:transposase
MADPYPLELRVRAVAAYEAGEGSYPTIAARFCIGEATIKRWVWLQQRQGTVAARQHAGGRLAVITLADVEELIAELHDPTARELTVAYNRRRRGARRIHVSTMKRALHRHGYVVKKNAEGRWRFCAPTSQPDA